MDGSDDSQRLYSLVAILCLLCAGCGRTVVADHSGGEDIAALKMDLAATKVKLANATAKIAALPPQPNSAATAVRQHLGINYQDEIKRLLNDSKMPMSVLKERVESTALVDSNRLCRVNLNTHDGIHVSDVLIVYAVRDDTDRRTDRETVKRVGDFLLHYAKGLEPDDVVEMLRLTLESKDSSLQILRVLDTVQLRVARIPKGLKEGEDASFLFVIEPMH